jgi:hypothetical protein
MNCACFNAISRQGRASRRGQEGGVAPARAAPRCRASCRSQRPCRGPAMANGRCLGSIHCGTQTRGSPAHVYHKQNRHPGIVMQGGVPGDLNEAPDGVCFRPATNTMRERVLTFKRNFRGEPLCLEECCGIATLASATRTATCGEPRGYETYRSLDVHKGTRALSRPSIQPP